MKKKLIALVTALTLCAVVVVGATLAYFSTQTKDVVNVFTYDPNGGGFNPDPEIQEPNWPGSPDVTPGTATPKDPQIVLTTPPTDADTRFMAAMIIRGEADISGWLLRSEDPEVKGKKEIEITTANELFDKSVHSYTKTIVGQVKDPDTGLMVDDPTHTRDVTVYQNVGLAQIKGWSNDFVYDVDSDGNIYAYYKGILDKDTVGMTTGPVFKSVVMNEYIQHFLDGITVKDEDFFNLAITGYVVSAKNDTEIRYDGSGNVLAFQDWESCKKAMMIAFPAEFPEDSATLTGLGTIDRLTDPTNAAVVNPAYTAAELEARLASDGVTDIWNNDVALYN